MNYQLHPRMWLDQQKPPCQLQDRNLAFPFSKQLGDQKFPVYPAPQSANVFGNRPAYPVPQSAKGFGNSVHHGYLPTASCKPNNLSGSSVSDLKQNANAREMDVLSMEDLWMQRNIRRYPLYGQQRPSFSQSQIHLSSLIPKLETMQQTKKKRRRKKSWRKPVLTQSEFGSSRATYQASKNVYKVPKLKSLKKTQKKTAQSQTSSLHQRLIPDSSALSHKQQEKKAYENEGERYDQEYHRSLESKLQSLGKNMPETPACLKSFSMEHRSQIQAGAGKRSIYKSPEMVDAAESLIRLRMDFPPKYQKPPALNSTKKPTPHHPPPQPKDPFKYSVVSNTSSPLSTTKAGLSKPMPLEMRLIYKEQIKRLQTSMNKILKEIGDQHASLKLYVETELAKLHQRIEDRQSERNLPEMKAKASDPSAGVTARLFVKGEKKSSKAKKKRKTPNPKGKCQLKKKCKY